MEAAVTRARGGGGWHGTGEPTAKATPPAAAPEKSIAAGPRGPAELRRARGTERLSGGLAVVLDRCQLEQQAAAVAQHEGDLWPGQRRARDEFADVSDLGGRRLEELAPRRRVAEQVGDLDARAHRRAAV